jgi:hypothetical protein
MEGGVGTSDGILHYPERLEEGEGMSSEAEERINQFMKAMGFSEQLRSDNPEFPAAKVALPTHTGVTFWVMLDNSDTILTTAIAFAFLPRTNVVAPLMRRLLELNATIAGGYSFGIQPNDLIVYKATRIVEGLDLVEFRNLCDMAAAGYWQFCAPLVQEFQLLVQH